VTTGQPILVPCEGGSHPGHLACDGEAMCSMCGEWVPLGADGEVVSDHDRWDLLAMLDRGDFG
jgi:hypothetical protein